MIRHNLPAQPTPFVGRQDELAEIARLLRDPACRLLTLMGPGGIGKTRLALEAAALNSERFPDGVYFVALQPLTSSDHIVPAIAQSIGFQFSSRGEAAQQLVEHLENRRLLLVLDNIEHLLDGAEVVADLLDSAPHVVALTTSRERLNLVQEWVFEVGGLAFPTNGSRAAADTYSAVQLFAQGASRVQRDFSLAHDLESVIRICNLTGGMPLALELASAWVRALPVEQIARELEHSFDILETSARNVSPRHRNMRAVLDYSWALLSDSEREAFAQLAVFRGGFTLDAALAVASATRSALVSLVDKSWVQYDADTARYTIHELLRQYGDERLDERGDAAQRAHARHCTYFARMLERQWTRMSGSEFKEANAEIEAELENVRAAWSWATCCPDIDAVRISLKSLWFFYDRGNRFQEGEQTFARAAQALAGAEGDARLVLGDVIARHGAMCYSLDLFPQARALLEQSIEILRPFGQTDALAFALLEMGTVVCTDQNDFLGARALFEQSNAMYRALNDVWGAAYTLNWMSNVTSAGALESEPTKSYDLARESLALFESLGNLWGIALASQNLIFETLDAGDYAGYLAAARHNRDLFREIEVRWGVVFAQYMMADAAVLMGKDDEAREYVREGLVEALKYKIVRHALHLLYVAALLYERWGELECQFEILGYIEAERLQRGQVREDHWRHLTALDRPLTPNLAAAVERGRASNFETMVRSVIEDFSRGHEMQPAAPVLAAVTSVSEPLTEREREVLRLVVEGKSNREIARDLVIALGTVKTHVHNVMGKLDAANRTQLSARARELDLL